MLKWHKNVNLNTIVFVKRDGSDDSILDESMSKEEAIKLLFLNTSVRVPTTGVKKVGKTNFASFKSPKNRDLKGETPIRDQNHGV
jgi:hypothetical protein